MESVTSQKPEPSYFDALNEFRKLGDVNGVYERTFDKVDRSYLSHVKHVIAIGTGPGLNEINFLKKLTPNLSIFTAVENDESCMKQLSENVKNLLPSHVSAYLNFSSGKNWQGPNEKEGKADLVLMFHCLYFFDENERKDLFGKCFNNWMKTNGIVFILHHKDMHETSTPYFMNDVYRETGRKLQLEAYTIKKELVQLGYGIDKVYNYEYYQDLSVVNDFVASFISKHAEPPFESDDIVKKVLKKLIDAGNKGYTSGDLFSVVKKS